MGADNKHFHHSLIKLGFSHSQSVGIIYFLMFFFGILGIIPVALENYPLWWVPWCGVLVLICLLIASIKIKPGSIANVAQKLTLYQKKSLKNQLFVLISVVSALQRYAIYLLLFSVSFIQIFKQTKTFLGMGIAISCLVMLSVLFIQKKCSFLLACLLVITTTTLFSLGNSDSIVVQFFSMECYLRTIYNFIFLFLFLSMLFLSAVSFKHKHFIITPTDILLVLIPLLILMMPDTWVHEYGLRLLVVRGLVLFASLRTFTKPSVPFTLNRGGNYEYQKNC